MLSRIWPDQFNSRSNSSLGLTPISRDMFRKEDFQTGKDSGCSLNNVKRESSKFVFIKKRVSSFAITLLLLSVTAGVLVQALAKCVLGWGFNCVSSVIESCETLSKSAQGLGTVGASVDRGANLNVSVPFFFQIFYILFYKFLFISYWNVENTISYILLLQRVHLCSSCSCFTLLTE